MEYKINEEIKEKEVRLILDSENKIVKTKDALKMAKEQKLDLVCISNADYPVCKIIDYKKFLYDKSKKERENKKNQTKTVIKEIKIPNNKQIFRLLYRCFYFRKSI